MKRLLCVVSMLVLVALTGCSYKNDQEPSVPFEITGNFAWYEQQMQEDGSSVILITIDCNGEYTTVEYTASVPDIDKMTVDFIVTLTGDIVGDVYHGTGISVDYLPLYYELGYDGYDLMSNTYDDYTFQSLLAKTYFSYVRRSGGREYMSSSKASHYIDQDEKASYHNVVKTIKDESGKEQSYSESTYTDKVTGELFTLINYGTWSCDEADNTEPVTFAVSRDYLTVESFDRLQGSLRVAGTLKGVPAGSYLEYLMVDTLGDMYESVGNTQITFDAHFDEETRNVEYIEYVILLDDFTYNGSVYTITELRMELNGMAFGNTDVVEIPSYVRVPIEEEPVEQEEEITVVTCAMVLGVEQEDITDEYVLTVIGDVYSEDGIASICDVDLVVSNARLIISTWTVEDLNSDLSTCDTELRIAAEKIVYYISGVPMAY